MGALVSRSGTTKARARPREKGSCRSPAPERKGGGGEGGPSRGRNSAESSAGGAASGAEGVSPDRQGNGAEGPGRGRKRLECRGTGNKERVGGKRCGRGKGVQGFKEQV